MGKKAFQGTGKRGPLSQLEKFQLCRKFPDPGPQVQTQLPLTGLLQHGGWAVELCLLPSLPMKQR